MPEPLHQRQVPVNNTAFLVVPVSQIPPMVSVRDPSDSIRDGSMPGRIMGQADKEGIAANEREEKQ
jgi:hypothetical protein